MIYLIDSYPISRNSHRIWRDNLYPYLLEKGYPVKLIEVKTKVPTSFQEWGSIYYQSEQYKSIFDLVLFDKINKGDIFIFENAFNSVALNLRYLIDFYKTESKIYGIWTGGSYYTRSRIKSVVGNKNKNWVHYFQKSLYYAYDCNLFFNDLHARMFRESILSGTKQLDPDKHIVMGYPLGNLTLERRNDKDPKLVSIALSHSEDKYKDILNAIKKLDENHNYFIFNKNTINRDIYLEIISKSSVVIFLDQYEDHLLTLYECLLLGTIPLVPDYGDFLKIVPQDLIYNHKLLIPPYLNFIRNADDFFSKVSEVSSNREKYLEIIEEPIGKLRNYYGNDKLEEFLKGVKYE